MRYTLVMTPYPDGYGEALLPLADCKAHLRVAGDGEDDAIAALRDAALQYVEGECEVRLGPSPGLQWRAEGLPVGSGQFVDLGVRPLASVESVSWLSTAGAEVPGVLADFRFAPDGSLRPVVGGGWPRDVGGGVVVTFTAGYAAGEAPLALLHAARMMLAHFYANRESVVTGTISGETPLGVAALCRPFQRVRL